MLPDAPTSPSPSSSDRSFHWFWPAIVMLTAVVLLLPNICYPMGPDQSLFAVCGRELLAGKRLYRDLWDVKPPGIFYVYEFLVKLFGPVMWSVGVADAISAIAFVYFAYYFAKKFVGAPAAAVSAITFAAWRADAGHWIAIQPDPLIAGLVLLNFFFLCIPLRHKAASLFRCFCVGLIFGLAFWLKYVALAYAPILLLLPYLSVVDSPRGKRLSLNADWKTIVESDLSFVAGFFVVVLGVFVNLKLQGVWQAFMDIERVLPHYSLEFVHLYGLHYPVWALQQTVSGLGKKNLLVVVLALLIAWKRKELARLWPILAAAAMSYIAVAGQFRFSPYTFTATFAFFAIFWGYLIVAVCEFLFQSDAFSGLAPNWSRARLSTASLLVVTVLYAGLQMRGTAARYVQLGAWLRSPDDSYAQAYWDGGSWNMPDTERVLRLLNDQDRVQTVFLWGNDSLMYLLTDTPLPTKFVENTWLRNPWTLQEWRDEEARDFQAAAAQYVVVARGDVDGVAQQDSFEALEQFPAIEDSLKTRYQLQASFAKFLVYRRTN